MRALLDLGARTPQDDVSPNHDAGGPSHPSAVGALFARTHPVRCFRVERRSSGDTCARRAHE